MKNAFTKILEPETGLVHVKGIWTIGGVTLCGITDWISVEQGIIIDKDITCEGCRAIIKFVHEHRKPRSMDKWL